MIRGPSKVRVGGGDSVQIPIGELHLFRRNLEDALKWVNKYISQYSAETIHEEEKTLDLFPPTRTRTRDDNKRVSLGLCMFVQKKNLVGVTSRDELETHKDRCRKKAYDLKGNVILCSRHKDSDIKRIEEILNGVAETVPPGSGDPLPGGDYRKPPESSGPAGDIEEVLNEMGRLERLFEENKFIPCRVKFRECALICFHGETFVVEPSGVCIGKITDKDALASFETKAKMKEYFDVDGRIERLTRSDLSFVEHFELYYNPQI